MIKFEYFNTPKAYMIEDSNDLKSKVSCPVCKTTGVINLNNGVYDYCGKIKYNRWDKGVIGSLDYVNRYYKLECGCIGVVRSGDNVIKDGSYELVDINRSNDTEMLSNIIFDNGDKITVQTVMKVVSGYNDNFQSCVVSLKVVINVKTGRSFVMTPKVIGGKRNYGKGHSLSKIAKATKVRGYVEITYLNLYQEVSSALGREMAPEAMNYLYDLIMEKKQAMGLWCPEFEKPKRSYYSHLTLLTCFNRYPEFGVKANLVIKNYAEFGSNSIPSFARKKVMKIKHNMPFYKEFFKSFKINSKALRKSLQDDLNGRHSRDKFYLFIAFQDIASVDNIVKLFNNSYTPYYYNDDLDNFVKMLRIMILKCGDTVAINKCLNESDKDKFRLRLLRDMYPMYTTLMVHDIPFEFKGTIKEMHDRMINLYRPLKSLNRVFEYKDRELDLQQAVGDYRFNIADDTDQLSDIGNKMSICVGGYADSVISNYCRIFYVTHKNSPEYLACIELRIKGEYIQIHQAKTRFNKYPTDELLEAILGWIEANKIKICTSDIQMHETSKIKAVA